MQFTMKLSVNNRSPNMPIPTSSSSSSSSSSFPSAAPSDPFPSSSPFTSSSFPPHQPGSSFGHFTVSSSPPPSSQQLSSSPTYPSSFPGSIHPHREDSPSPSYEPFSSSQSLYHRRESPALSSSPPEHPSVHSFPIKPNGEEAPREVTCSICGKIYKHKSCLSKHLWEHHEHWETTKKFCSTKHQQVFNLPQKS